MPSLLQDGLTLDPRLVIELSADDGDEPGGVLADRLSAAFESARDGGRALGEGGCIVFAVNGCEALQAGASALARSLALEWAPRGIRVNVVVGDQTGELIDFIAGPAGRMLTGAVLQR